MNMRDELRDEELNVKKTIAVIDATFAVVKRKPKKIQACTGYP